MRPDTFGQILGHLQFFFRDDLQQNGDTLIRLLNRALISWDQFVRVDDGFAVAAEGIGHGSIITAKRFDLVFLGSMG